MEKTFEDIIPLFVERKYNRTDNARYWVALNDGTHVKCGNTSCHAGLRYPGLGGKIPVAVINQIQQPLVGEEIAARFYEWLLNYSPYRNVFITKSIRDAFANNVIVTTAEAPANLMVGGLMASRFATENYLNNYLYRYCRVWDKLVQLGVHPSAAYCASIFLRPDSDDEKTNLSLTVPLSGHMSIDGDNRTFFNFIGETPQREGEPYAKNPMYNTITGVWHKNSGRDEGLLTVLEQALNRTRKSASKNNPFNVQPKTSKFQFHEGLEEVAKAINDYMKENAIAEAA